ncbi:DUF6507 family protein [Streptomyces cinnamoneus]|uniref:Uncharacterized protein n=1 Tax=Streptomyces cinnamoneus TaxID=53446 RepID=A0A918U3I2_STRCJ|nr:DUF6507 family protein [Streptomyces cinnamoneus]GHC72384.1 hypothetical protein GCM10010507_59400 [Streptomyces cinnamoneus]
MSQWDIKPAGVRGVISRTSEVIGKLGDESTSYSTHTQSAAGHAGALVGPCDASQGLVGLALAAYTQHATPELAFIAVRAKKSLQGAIDATAAYEEGDLEMAANKQAAACKAPTPEELAAVLGKRGDKK